MLCTSAAGSLAWLKARRVALCAFLGALEFGCVCAGALDENSLAASSSSLWAWRMSRMAFSVGDKPDPFWAWSGCQAAQSRIRAMPEIYALLIFFMVYPYAKMIVHKIIAGMNPAVYSV